MKNLVWLLLIALMTACTSSGRYTQRHDSKPERIRADIDFRDAIPRFEPYNPANLRPYTVLGKHYVPLKSGKGYTETGVASWYGQKFHGHQTANGETYDMFTLSAAHKTLPLPSFVRVTNLDNGKQAVVRVNDRGPFHHNRVIDLSYAAALKLDVLGTGTARVKLDIMHIDEQGVLTIGNTRAVDTQVEQALFIQVAALQDKSKIERMAQGLATLLHVDAHTPKDGEIYRLRLGPIEDKKQADEMLKELQRSGYEQAYTLYAPR